MPTKRHRLLVTETDELAAALDEAASERRVAGVRQSAGSVGAVWPPNARERLRQEWPE
jgi:hypothetical protein